MKKKMIIISLAAIIAVFTSNPALFSDNKLMQENKGNIIVDITNFKNNEGSVLVGLYNNGKGFPGTAESMIMSIKTNISDKKATAEFKDVPYGTYAVSGYQDENSNGKLDTGFFKIPKEGTIVSNNAKGKRGPAKYEDAKFELKSKSMRLDIKMQFF